MESESKNVKANSESLTQICHSANRKEARLENKTGKYWHNSKTPKSVLIEHYVLSIELKANYSIEKRLLVFGVQKKIQDMLLYC